MNEMFRLIFRKVFGDNVDKELVPLVKETWWDEDETKNVNPRKMTDEEASRRIKEWNSSFNFDMINRIFYTDEYLLAIEMYGFYKLYHSTFTLTIDKNLKAVNKFIK
jgi:hypothetical protein